MQDPPRVLDARPHRPLVRLLLVDRGEEVQLVVQCLKGHQKHLVQLREARLEEFPVVV